MVRIQGELRRLGQPDRHGHHPQGLALTPDTAQPCEKTAWATQLARELTADLAEAGRGFTHLIRDPGFPSSRPCSTRCSPRTGIKVMTTGPQAPRMSAIAERFVHTTRAECTDRMLVAVERHARLAMAQNVKRYNTGRSRQLLGGLINKYQSAA